MNSDTSLNEVGVLQRREIEARILAPILEALGQAFGKDAVLEITRRTIAESHAGKAGVGGTTGPQRSRRLL